MYRLLLFFIVFMTMAGLHTPLRAQKSPNFASIQAPEFQFEPSRSHDFDTVPQSEWISHDFWFINIGGQPLRITKVRGSCYCTKAEFPTAPIQPGERGYIRVFYDTRSKIGQFRAAVSIISNALGTDTEHLFVEGNIISPISVSPMPDEK